jgi:hypothetical protein
VQIAEILSEKISIEAHTLLTAIAFPVCLCPEEEQCEESCPLNRIKTL